MDAGTTMSAVWGAVFVIVILAVIILRAARGRGSHGRRTRRGGVGSAAAGAVYGLLNDDKQKAVDIIVEGQAESRRPEYPDGNLPDLQKPKR